MTAGTGKERRHAPARMDAAASEALPCGAGGVQAATGALSGLAPHVRQPAYDAATEIIRQYPARSTDDYGATAENARVWRAVEAALDAMGVPE